MYFTTTTTTTFWAYNTGSLTFQIQSVRFYDSAGLVNLLLQLHAERLRARTDQVYDLRSALAQSARPRRHRTRVPR